MMIWLFTNLRIHKIIGLILLVFIASCSKKPDPLTSPIQTDSSIQLIVSKNNVPSDNYSFDEVSALTKYRPNANDIIVFKTDRGVFSNDSSVYTVNVSSNDTTRAFLRYNSASIIRVTATIFNKYSKEVYIKFLTSYPSQILTYPDSSSLKASFTSKTLIKSKLLRPVGFVSKGLTLNYYDSIATSTGGSIGSFLNSTYSDSLGQMTVQYCLQDTAYHGFVFIKNYIDTGNGRVYGMSKVYIR